MTRQRGLLLVRLAAAFAAIATLTGSIVVSCSGDPTPGGGGGGSNAPSSDAMGRWTPATQDTCTKEFHDSFFVVGPDGKKYPTWHPPEATDPDTSQLCRFGHDHGTDPSTSDMWPALQAHFAFDANRNGTIDASELEVSGIPFGLVSETLVNSGTPRREEHTGYKILLANDRPRQLAGGGAFDLQCDLFAAYNQATSSEDAFASNMFSVTYAVDCNQGTSLDQYRVKVIVSAMGVYGDSGAFTLDTSGTQEQVGKLPVPPNSPPGGGELGRLIPTVDEVFAGVFVPAGQSSNFNALFERWETQLRLRRPNASELATLKPAFRVDTPARYYDGAALNGLARSIDLCYSGLDGNGTVVTDPTFAGTVVRRARGGLCAIAPNGPATPINERIAFDDVRSPFNACSRHAFFGADVVRNQIGPEIWYTDAFGGNANVVQFPNSIKQLISAEDTGTVVLAEAQATQQFCQSTQVHVPN